MQLSVDFFYQLGINELQKKFGWGSATSRTYSVSVDVVFVAWDDIGTGAFGPEVEQSVSDLAVWRVERVADAVERLTDTQSVEVKWDTVQKTHRREQQSTHQTLLWSYFQPPTLWHTMICTPCSETVKTHNLATQEYDVTMTSLAVGKSIKLFHQKEYLIPPNILWKNCGSLNIFHEDIKNVSGCFTWTQSRVHY